MRNYGRENVTVSLETFGDRRIEKPIGLEDVSQQDMRDLLAYMVAQKWSGEAAQNLAIVKKQMSASGGYTASVATGDVFGDAKFQPVRLGDKVRDMIVTTPTGEKILRVSVNPVHKVGYY